MLCVRRRGRRHLEKGAGVRFLIRMAGYLLVALGFITMIVDGAGAIANGALQFTTIGDALHAVLHERYDAIASAIARDLHPWLADHAFATLMRAPVAAAALLVGFGLLWLARPPQPLIGIVTRQ